MSEESEKDLEIKLYGGYLLPVPKIFKEENVEASVNHRARDGDIILCSYPKTGNTWMTYIIWLILQEDEPDARTDERAVINVPFIEIHGIKPVENLSPPRFYKTHLPYGIMKVNEKAKYIYTYRMPDDTVVSYYYYRKAMRRKDVDFDTFFLKFLKGVLPYGDYFNHVLAAYAHKDDGHFLLVSYEDMKESPRNEIFRIAKFLGDRYYERLKSSESVVEKILEKTTFDYMKKNLKVSVFSQSVDVRDERHVYFRKGVVGEGNLMLKEEQKNQLWEKTKVKMRDTDILEKWLQPVFK